MIIGAQLYTVRDFAKDLDGFAETLKRVADIGYKTVQVSGTCDFEAAWLAEELRKNGLSCVLTHTKPADILDKARFAAEIGCKVLIPHHQDFTEVEDPKLLQQFEADFLSLVPDGTFINPAHGEWIHL